ncbi:stress responsive alpha/beta barrel protein [Dyadobacter jejuensis]|uniref:Stress responsive alpha/beta barrel protein n=1 Tax=Dyadobacter jejuensis TaxID=1082580 RepID=A0A316AIM5_9BACT|nr:Dabb family protein [Dyadobacter jejuensis]PWJ57573.1 stress responsive alpha/beta barrel protein [Dyadobacter jejuensis]
MFIHNVFFWLKDKSNDADRAALLKGIESLKSIESVHTAYVGTPAGTNRPVIDASYDFAEILVFEDEAAHDVYQIHPIHTKFVEDCAHLWEKVVIYDVEA